MLSKSRSLFAPIFFLVAPLCLAQENSVEPCVSLLARAVVAHYEDSNVYRPSYCLFNSVCLAEVLNARFPQKIDRQELRLLVIHYDGRNLFAKNPDTRFNTKKDIAGMAARKKEQEKPYALWRFHAVLEYRNQILDLDLDAPMVLKVSKYFAKMFSPSPVVLVDKNGESLGMHWFNRPEEIVIRSIPLSLAQEKFSQMKIEEAKLSDVSFVGEYPAVSLKNFLESASSE